MTIAARPLSPPADRATPGSVLDFWFGPEAEPFWFERSDAFDRVVVEHLLPRWQPAREGRFDHWAASPEGALALIILFDQVPRNAFRSDPRAFASDVRARAVARSVLDRGLDAGFTPKQRLFLYLPFEHAEDAGTQELSMALFRQLHGDDPEQLKWAARHAEIIHRFGRFPHRNASLGRASTPEEIAFLQEPMSSF